MDRCETLSFRYRVDEISDGFEQACIQGACPNLCDFLGSWRGRQRQLLLHELIMFDMDYRWRSCDEQRAGTQSEELPQRPLLEHYVRRFSELESRARLPLTMIGFEYQIRCRQGPPPPHDEYAQRFADHRHNVMQHISNLALHLWPARILIYDGQRLTFRASLSVPLELGRQRSAEPGPYAVVPNEEGQRIVIAPLTQTTVSRRQLYLDLAAANVLRVSNRCVRNPVQVHAGSESMILAPGARRDLALPALFSLENMAIRIESERR